MTSITACIICKNEEAYIASCIRALQEQGIPIVVTDTGSTDRTLSIVSSLLKSSDRLCHFPWVDDFSAARNFCAAQAHTDWIWAVDADEILSSCDHTALTQFLSDSGSRRKIGTVRIKNAYPMPGSTAFASTRIGRIYHRRYSHFEGSIHEQLTTIDIPATPDTFADLPLCFAHMGYESPETLERKCLRNIALLKTEYQRKKDPYNAYQLGKAFAALGRHDEAVSYFEEGLSFDLNPSLQYVQDMVQTYGYSLLELKRYQTALSFEQIYDAFATNADFVFLMGLIYMNNALFEEAIAQFTKALLFSSCTVDGTNSYLAHYNKGVILECMGRTDEARESYLACGAFEPAEQRLAALR